MTLSDLKAQRERCALEGLMYSLDLLTAAWGWSQDEIAQAMHTTVEELREWRGHYKSIPKEALDRFRQLESVQYTLWATARPGEYARIWRTPIETFGGKTPIQVTLSGDNEFKTIIGLCRSATW